MDRKMSLLWASMLLMVLVPGSSGNQVNSALCTFAPGINFGQEANNLRGPSEIAQFLHREHIQRVRLYHTYPETMKSFEGKSIQLTISISNAEIKSSAMAWNYNAAEEWVKRNIIPYTSTLTITTIAVGDEVTSCKDWDLVSQTEPAMRNIYSALKRAGLSDKIKVSTPFGMDILEKTWPPSEGTFRVEYAWNIVLPVLTFLNETGAPFMINLFTYNSYRNDPQDVNLDAALLNNWAPISVDPKTGHVYKNLLVQLMDATVAAMERMGRANISLVVMETGWPNAGDHLATVENAARYNQNLVNWVMKGLGTPMRPRAGVNAFIYSLFNENLKKGAEYMRNYGLYRPDFTPFYDIDWEGEPDLVTRPSHSSSR